MLSRRFVALAVALFGLAVGVAAPAQDKKDDKKAEKKPDDKKPEEKKPAAGPGVGEREPIETADGVRLSGVFYRATGAKEPAKAPVVLCLHAYGANPDEAVWDDTARTLAKEGYHVLRFAFRGHGESKDLSGTGREFWSNPINQKYVKGSEKAATKTTIDKSDFKNGYYPMLVQDIAAARHHLDKKNDDGILNSSSIYLLGSGDAVNLGMLFIASEWYRERKRPNQDVIIQKVFPGRPIFQGFDVAGTDIRGAIWLSPAPAPGGSPSAAAIKSWVMTPATLDMRVETQMAFFYGKKDTKSEGYVRTLTGNQVLNIAPKDYFAPDKKAAAVKLVGPRGQPLPNPEETYTVGIKDTNLAGTKLLGNNLGTEKIIPEFIGFVEKLRQNRQRTPNRGWDNALYIDVQAFGAVR